MYVDMHAHVIWYENINIVCSRTAVYIFVEHTSFIQCFIFVLRSIYV